MVLYEDTRQQARKHLNVHSYCERAGIRIIRQALNVGDYQIAGKGDISVDTKMGVLELAGNVFQEHERFRAECLRAKECGIQLIILIEEALPGGRLDRWRSPVGRDGLPLTRFDPATLRKAMITMQTEYGVKFRFCDGRSTGRMLIEYLEGRRK
jgi:ERCC4-type nuclease